MAKVNIISGFLGAGKTTFIKELIRKVFQGQKVVLIENEFGEIGIDGGFLKESGIQINEMNSGCICCSLVGDFKEALSKVEEQFHPDRILIEPSGVGKLSDVEKAVKSAPKEANIEIEGKIAVVDAKKAKKYLKNFGEFFSNQVQYADTVVLSRTADIDEDKLAECLQVIRELNGDAPIITTDWTLLDGQALSKALTEKSNPLDLLEAEDDEDDDDEECCCCHHDGEEEHHHHHHHHDDDDEEEEHHHHHHHDDDEEEEHHHHHHDDEEEEEHHHHHHHHHHGHEADEIFTSWGTETVHKYEKEELTALLADLAGTEKYGVILRAKGIVALTDGSWAEFDMVPEETELRPCAADYTGRVVVIGTDLKEAEIKAAFHVN